MDEAFDRHGAGDLEGSSEWLTRLARGLVSEANEADDLAQDTWLAWWQSASPVRELRPFLNGVARHLALQRFRSQSRRRHRERSVARPEALPAGDEVAERLEIQRWIVEALSELPTPQRNALYLRYFVGLDAVEIARREGVTHATARKRIERGLAELRARLDAKTAGRARDWRWVLVPGLGADTVGASVTTSWFVGGVMMKWGVAVALALLVAWWAFGASRQDSLEPPLETASMRERPTDSPAEPAVAPVGSLAADRRSSMDTNVAASAAGVASRSTHAVHVRVIDEAGRALKGADVVVPETDLATTSDEEGRARLDVPLDVLAGLPRASRESIVWIEVRAAGRATRRFVRARSSASETWIGDVVLAAGLGIRGRVADEHGAPVAGARVVVLRARNLEPAGGRPLFFTDPDTWHVENPLGFGFGAQPDPRTVTATRTETRADGRFEISGLERGWYRAWATEGDRPWTESAPLELSPGEDLGDVVLDLHPPAPDQFVHVVVVDENGRPLPHAGVSWNSGTSGVRTLQGTDAHGRLRVHRDPAEPPWSWLAVAAPPLRPEYVSPVDPKQREFEFRLRPASHVAVRVVDSAGEPITHGRVLALPLAETRPGFTAWALVDGDGQARVAVEESPFRLHVEAVGHESAIFGPIGGELSSGETGSVPIVVRLDRRADAIVGVVKRDGRAVSGARVLRLDVGATWNAPDVATWSGEGEPFVAWSQYPYDEVQRAVMSACTDASGRFAIPSPYDARVTTIRVWVEVPNETAFLSEPVPLASARSGAMTFELPPGGTVSGSVVHGTRSTAGWFVRACNDAGVVVATVVDGHGRYTLRGLAAGAWQVRAFEPDAPLELARFLPVEHGPRPDLVLAAGAALVHDVDLSAVSRPLLRGKIVVDGDDQRTWTVSIAKSGGSGHPARSQVRSAPDGTFEVELLRGEPTVVTIVPEFPRGLAHWELRDVVPTASGVVVRRYDLTTGEVEGELSGAPQEPAWIDYEWHGGGAWSVRVREVSATSSPLVGRRRVPCGAGRFLVRDESDSGRDVVLREVDVPCGGRLALGP